jgi:hypothetical protein
MRNALVAQMVKDIQDEGFRLKIAGVFTVRLSGVGTSV